VRSPLPLLIAFTGVGLVALALHPLVAAGLGAVAVVVGLVVRLRSDRVLGLGLVGSGVALGLAAVLLLVLVDRHEAKVVHLDDRTGLSLGSAAP
jgi:hypothetical protein